MLDPFRHYLLISYMLLPDVWCNRALCVDTAHSTYFTATSPLVSVLFVPPLHSYYFSRNVLFFSMFVATSQEVQKIAITLTSSRHTLVYKKYNPTKAASDGDENIPVHLSVRELERLEKKNWKKKKKKKKKTKCGKCRGRFPRAGASSRGRTVSAVWCVVHTCSSPVQFAVFKAL